MEECFRSGWFWLLKMKVEEFNIILALFGLLCTGIVTAVICTWWLSQRLRAIEVVIYREVGLIKKEIEKQLDDHERRLTEMEVYVFAFPKRALAPRPKRSEGSSFVGSDDI